MWATFLTRILSTEESVCSASEKQVCGYARDDKQGEGLMHD